MLLMFSMIQKLSTFTLQYPQPWNQLRNMNRTNIPYECVCRVDQKEKRSASTRCASTSSTALASSRMSRHGTTSYVS